MPNLAFRPDLMSRRRSTGGGAPPTLSEQMEALLFGTNGWALDPTDLATMWQESTKVTPAASGQVVGALRTKWGNAQFDFLQATGTQRPIWDGVRFIVPDGIDDRLLASGPPNIWRNAPAYFFAMRFGGAVNNNPFFNSARVILQPATGKIRTTIKRLDADVATTDFGVTGTGFSGLTVFVEADLAETLAVNKYSDNSLLDVSAHPGPAGNSSDTDITPLVLLNNNGGSYQTGSLGRCVALPFLPSAGQRATIQSWLTEV